MHIVSNNGLADNGEDFVKLGDGVSEVSAGLMPLTEWKSPLVSLAQMIATGF